MKLHGINEACHTILNANLKRTCSSIFVKHTHLQLLLLAYGIACINWVRGKIRCRLDVDMYGTDSEIVDLLSTVGSAFRRIFFNVQCPPRLLIPSM
jgi:hypothetical protein